MEKIFGIFGLFLNLIAIAAHAQSDWKEGGDPGSCAWAKGETIPIYLKIGDVRPILYEEAQGKFYWAVDRQSNWVRLRANKTGAVLGWTRTSKIVTGPPRNCAF